MHLSISSVLISLFLASILVLLLHFLLTATRVYKVFRIDFVFIFALIIGVRLFFPFEFINTHTLSSHKVLPALYSLVDSRLSGVPVHIGTILAVVWVAGSLIFLGRFVYRLLELNGARACSVILDSTKLSARLKIIIPPNIQVRQMTYVSSPFVCYLFKPTIIIPDVAISDETLTYILLHELQHIRNRDILYKYISQILVCLYWWFPPVWLYRKQVDMILEMRVDYKVTTTIDNGAYFSYVESLLDVAQNILSKEGSQKQLDDTLLSHFTIIEKSTLKRRVKFLLEGFNVKRTSRAIRVCLFLIPILVTSVIIEPDYATPSKVTGTKAINSNNSYIIKKKNEFHLYIDGTDMGSFKSLNDPALDGVPVRK